MSTADSIQSYYATDRDARRYAVSSNVIVVLLIALDIGVAYGVVAPWGLMLAIALLLPRWMIYTHELFHVRKANEVDWLNRLMPLPFTPISLGYREFREIHMGHHRAPATEKDPDAFHILGGPLKAFLGALTLSEQAIARWLKSHPLDRELATGIVVRLAIFGSLAFVAQWWFLAFWLALRVNYAVGDFVFFHYLHVREGKVGSYPLKLPAAVEALATALAGKTLVAAILYHDRHHAYPRVAAHHLSALPSYATRQATP